jgi:hypothetical protein
MVNCCVAGCTSGYKSNPEKIPQFCVPKDVKQREVWAKVIPRRDFISTQKHFVSNISVKMTP